MRILAVSDHVSAYLSTPAGLRAVGPVDAVLSCGDLPYDYLEYLVTLLDAPLGYVHGNHDAPLLTESGEILTAPRGCTDLNGRIVSLRGRDGDSVIAAGLEGSMFYGGSRYQLTEREMARQTRRLIRRNVLLRMIGRQGIDVLITHAPPRGIHDGTDPAHTGFESLLRAIDRLHPELHLHGHTHAAAGYDSRPVEYGSTRILSVYGYEMLERERREARWNAISR